MKKIVAVSVLASMIVGTTVFAADSSPFGQFGTYDKVDLTVEKLHVESKGVIIDGNLYVPMDVLTKQNKAAYYYDAKSFQAYLFFGGGSNDSGNSQSRAASSNNTSRSAIEDKLMESIPYDAKNYHSGMMRQDVINIAMLAKSLAATSDDLEKAVFAKMSGNINPDMKLLRQRVSYRTIPFDVMSDRMEVLADELGRQSKPLGTTYKRRMNDVIDYLRDAVRDKEKALDALEDWLDSSDKDDLQDYRDYDKDANKNIDKALKYLTGESTSGSSNTDNLKAKIDEWLKKKGTK